MTRAPSLIAALACAECNERWIINAALDSIRDHAGRAALALGAGPLALGGGAAMPSAVRAIIDRVAARKARSVPPPATVAVNVGGADMHAMMRNQAAQFKSYIWHATRNGSLALPQGRH